MSRVECLAGVFTLLALAASTPSTFTVKGNEEWLFSVDQVSGERMMRYVEDLAAFETRFALSEGANLTAKYLYSHFSALRRFNVAFHHFPLLPEDGRVGLNVVACKPGLGRSGEHVLLFAHYDSVSNDPYVSAPGADDNAAGVAVMMEVAYLMSLRDWNRTLVFIAFSGEEIGFTGSSAWVKENEGALKNVVGGICLDGVGRGEAISVMYADDGSKALADLVLNVSTMLGFMGFRSEASVLGVEGSDSHVFLGRGLRIIRLWDEDTTYIHSPLDLPETLYLSRLLETAKVVTAVLRVLSTEPLEELRLEKPVKPRAEGKPNFMLVLAAALLSFPPLLIYALLRWGRRFPSSRRWVNARLKAYIACFTDTRLDEPPLNDGERRVS